MTATPIWLKHLVPGNLIRTYDKFISKDTDVPINCILNISNNPNEACLVVGSRLLPRLYFLEDPKGDVPFTFKAVTKAFDYSELDKQLDHIKITVDGDGQTFLRIYYSYAKDIWHFLRTIRPPVEGLKLSPYGWGHRGKWIQLKLIADIKDFKNWVAIKKIEVIYTERNALYQRQK